jgi:two-component system, cell cycle sensor histidine kinase and response regulator CckA
LRVDGLEQIPTTRAMTRRPAAQITGMSLDELFAFIPDAAVAVDRAGRVVAANVHAAVLFGYDRETLIGKTIEALLPERFRESHPDVRAGYQASPHIRRMGAAATSLFGRRSDASEFPVEIMLAPFAVSDGVLTVAVISDLTWRDRQPVAARLAAIVETSADAMLAMDRSGVITAWNHAAERLFGYARDEIVGAPISTIIPDDCRADAGELMRQVWAGGTVASHRTIRRHRDGDRIDVALSIAPIRDATGQVVGASATVRDIRSELHDEAQRDLAHGLVQNSRDAIAGFDVHGIMTAWNPAAERIFGYSADAVIGRPVAELRANVDAPDTDEIADVLAGESITHEVVRRARDGRELILSVVMNPVRDANGLISGAMTITRDVTVIRNVERNARAGDEREAALKAELEQTQRLESIGQLAGGVAHDFNNLLGVILNYAEFVIDELPADSGTRDDVEEIREAARRGADLTRQLLIFSRREAVRLEAIDVNQLVLGLKKFLRRALGEHVVLTLELDPRPRQISADPGRIEQVLVNLAVNGRDAMPDGGPLVIKTSLAIVDKESAPQHAGVEPGEYVVLTVSDDGCGMSPEVAQRAFDPFYTTKPKGQGTGLGLATVWAIANEAGGRVGIYSEPGIGTTIKVFLPTSDQPAGAVATRSAATTPSAHGEVVLIVEDEKAVRRVAERILTRAGYSVRSAADGPEALESLAKGPIDVLLTDVIMPGMLGPEVAAKVRAAQPGVKVIFMSGYSDRLLSRKALDGPDAGEYIEKPYTAAQLTAKVRSVLDAPGASPNAT